MKELKISGTLRCVVVVPGVWVCVGATVVSGGFQSLSTFSFDLKCSTKEHQKSKSLFFFSFAVGRWMMLIPHSGGVE